MNRETYERMRLVITEFDTEDVIMTSVENPDPGTDPGGNTQPAFVPGEYEMPLGF